jgi:hypothetical protein
MQSVNPLKAGRTAQRERTQRYNVSQSTISRLAEKRTVPAAGPLLDPETERATKVSKRHIAGNIRPLKRSFTGAAPATPIQRNAVPTLPS